MRNQKQENNSTNIKVLIVSTSEMNGGAALAAKALMEALLKQGVSVNMLVAHKQTPNPLVTTLSPHWKHQAHFIIERVTIWAKLHFRRKNLWALDIANTGTDITQLTVFQQADIIHLHWINQGMLSLKDIQRILHSGKKVVWTMHDLWPATALCHLPLQCQQYTTQCTQCQYLPKTSKKNNLATRVFKRKADILQHAQLTFVAPSLFLTQQARKSALLNGQQVITIPNPINTDIFKPSPQKQARQALQLPTDTQLILFAAQRADNPNKGIQYLIQACQLLASTTQHVALVIVGTHAEQLKLAFNINTYTIPYISNPEQMALLYNAADVFVLPSLAENLPNTILEAMACATPCVAFHVGGIPEQIQHLHNGYLAQYKNPQDLAQGIRFVLQNPQYQQLCQNALQTVMTTFSQQAVANKFINLYNN